MSIDEAFEEHLRVTAESRRALAEVLERVAKLAVDALRDGHKILACGNGGSAADAQHFAAECVCRFETERQPLPAIALTTDTSALTAAANDYGYEFVFARQFAAHARRGDVLFALSTSGNSPSVLRAAERARAMGCPVVAFTGAGGGKLSPLADEIVSVPSSRVSRVQEVHAICLHAVAFEIDRALTEAVSRG